MRIRFHVMIQHRILHEVKIKFDSVRQSTDHYDNPYFLHSTDHVGLQLVTDRLSSGADLFLEKICTNGFKCAKQIGLCRRYYLETSFWSS